MKDKVLEYIKAEVAKNKKKGTQLKTNRVRVLSIRKVCPCQDELMKCMGQLQDEQLITSTSMEKGEAVVYLR